ncbi:MAG: hypothetical protein CV087_15310 [Candidatus Brocadia sp. WS118]|nr:MAG: hypothetical protein CV087_15310 [Candidatus Brocadia sp. WS118]
MKITVDLSKSLEKELKKTMKGEIMPMSSFIEEAIGHYIKERKRKRIAKKALALVGKAKVSPNALKELEE